MTARRHSPRLGAARQRGVTLIVALVMLLAMALLAVWAYNGSTGNLRIVGNTQVRQEAFAAAQAAIETTISSSLFVQDAAAVAASPIPVDVHGNGTAAYTARLEPAPLCYRVRPVGSAELDPTVPTDLPCMMSQAPNGIESELPGAAAGASLCSDMEWNIRAVVTDAPSGTSVAANQGVAVRGFVTDAATGCP
ncbi:MAG TPA: PilX N-terminal domain-containing pilus assembly protein [Caldimonas sp.]|jgi:Tfp pilus assembly protein PilV|nr:PilX N-terminal domain-containing pilus assembly protein [Caldimonas sp.]HEX2539949.1 PilX N-terminal domain-containing pilus assembly protein [Caldimonas sp.]